MLVDSVSEGKPDNDDEMRIPMRHALIWMPLWVAVSCVLPHASAQEVDANHYDGTWAVRFRCPDGSACTARMVLKDFEGTWQDVNGTRFSKRACGGKKIPLSVQSSKLTHLAFTVWGEAVAPGCPTLSLLVKPVNGKLLEGSYDVGVHESESPEVHASHSAAPPSGQPASKDTGTTAAAAAAAAGAGSARSVRLERR